jgi:hypothetical protein
VIDFASALISRKLTSEASGWRRPKENSRLKYYGAYYIPIRLFQVQEGFLGLIEAFLGPATNPHRRVAE